MRLERSKGVCRRRDIVHYFTVHGFESREGGRHTVVFERQPGGEAGR